LQAHGRDDLAARLLNGWLQRTGDFAMLPALRFYMVYRALVRALVAALKARNTRDQPNGAAAVRPYLQFAMRTIAPRPPCLLLCHGYSGSGKSAASKALATLIGAIRLSSDVERKRTHAFAPYQAQPLPAHAYSVQATDRHYAALLILTRQVLSAGYPALVDATFLQRAHRERFVALARSLCVPVLVLDFHARIRPLIERVCARAAGPQGASDAGLTVLIRQLANEEPLTAQEMACTVWLDTEVPLSAYARRAYWHALLPRLPDRPGFDPADC
jgi:predicted kinase